MVASLRTVARRYSSVVAVVGRGHLSGIADHWTKDINVSGIFA
jgi:pheromone shutdown protein TraB